MIANKEFLLYVMLGGILTLFEWICFYVLVFMCEVQYLIANIAVFVAISALGIIVYKKAIFKSSHLSIKHEIIAIYAINIFGIVLNSFILWLCVEIANINVMIGKIIASFLGAFYGFFMRKNFIYIKGKNE